MTFTLDNLKHLQSCHSIPAVPNTSLTKFYIVIKNTCKYKDTISQIMYSGFNGNPN